MLLLLASWAGAQEDDAHDDLGQELYETHCASCHQEDGSGIEGQFPALNGSDIVTGDPHAVIAYPLEGPGEMPSFAETLDDEQIAAIVSYIRTAWDNEAEPVDASLVAEVRQDLGVGSPDGEEEIDFAWEELGADVYARNCAACHQADGTGIEGAYPAFVGNPFVLSDPEPPIRVVLHGRGGMPSFRNDLSDEQIAAVLSHVRNSWGNDAPPIAPETVAEVRGGEDEAPEGERPGAAD